MAWKTNLLINNFLYMPQVDFEGYVFDTQGDHAKENEWKGAVASLQNQM
jgi:hypothetical protein